MRETAHTIPGPAGDLEARVTGLDEIEAGAPEVAVVCHPHPLFGGTMQNKVVTTLTRVWRDRGVPVARFNYRGVGRSSGTYGEGVGEGDDAIAVAAWLNERNPGMRTWLAGFSFGSFVAAQAAQRLHGEGREIARLVLVAPAVVNFDFGGLLPGPYPTLVLQGDADEVVEPAAVFRWIETLDPAPVVEVFPGCSHFFHGRLPELKERLNAVLDGTGQAPHA